MNHESMGISSERAFDRLIIEAKSTISEWYSIHVVNKLKPVPRLGNKIRTFSHYYCTRTFIFIRLTLILLIIGSVDIDNRIQWKSFITYIGILIYTILLEIWQNRVRAGIFQYKYRKAFEEIEKMEKNKPTRFVYNNNLEAATDDMAIFQSCIRDGQVVEVPRLMLVMGDVIVFRPGQTAPCNCETFDGQILIEGDRIEWNVKKDEMTGVIEPLESIYARVTSYPIKSHLETTLSADDNPLQFDHQLQYTIHTVFEKCIMPITLIASIFLTLIRFYYADDETLFGTRFVFAVPGLTIFPILIIQLPLIFHYVKYQNNKEVIKYLGLDESFESYKDLVSILSSITGTSFIDKKGILSSIHPSIEKVVFGTNQIDENGRSMHLEVINLSSDQDPNDKSKWNLSFDDPGWKRYHSNLLPLSYNLLLNSCKQSEQFHRFLDHLSVISLKVPRTIATANRRCMCQLPTLLGFTDKSIDNLTKKEAKIIGFYKRQPGEAPLPGLTKHRTPIEMAFCTIHDDSQSLHSHLSCQGTANIVVDACSHIWNGETVVPMSKRLKLAVKDFYQRHSMTGHCLAVSYRPIFSKLSPSIDGKFIEIPLNREVLDTDNTAIPRSHSSDSINGPDSTRTINDTESVIDEYFTGNILCGLVVLHYEALPHAVTVIEKLDQICVRPVYFSKENELRSRVFAEKLGIEAGWNCHISFAEDDTNTKKSDVAHEQFVKQKPTKSKIMKRFALSESNLESLDCESLIRGSPSIRKMSVVSNKVGPIPNIARLPTGVKNVRPHLEEVDNVPLLVGLFTDSTTAAVEEMIDIMQENGEVVLTIGSSKNMSNTLLFTKANISICVDDVDEVACKMEKSKQISNMNDMASKLISLAADFRMNHDTLLKLPSLIVCARHRMASFRHSLLFLLYSSLLLSLNLLLSTTLFLPIIFTHSQVLLTSLFHIPILFFGTLFTSFNPNKSVIRIAPKNSDEVPKIEKLKTVTTFLMQFVPTSFYLNSLFFVLLMSNSNIMCSFSDISCIFNTDGSVGSEPFRLNNTTTDNISLSTETIRHIIGFQLIICLCVLSSSFVYGLSSMWSEVPFRCVKWNISIIICITTQILYSYFRNINILDIFQLLPLISLLVWVIFIILSNELIKIRRILQFSREQRRTKFDFDTKLGMNSPY